MKILFVSQYYPPESNAPANRVSELAKEWARLGHEVTVLTTFPNHPEGRIFGGYANGRPVVESDAGVRVVRVPVYIAANRGIVRRSLAYLSFSVSASIFGARVCESPDVVIATSPQLLVGVAGAWLATRFRRPLVLEVRDLWPDSIVAVGALREGHLAIRALRVLERWLYRRASRIAVVTESFRAILQERGVEDRRILFLPNGVDAELFHPTPATNDPIGAKDRWPGKFVVCFAGTIGMAHGLKTLIDAATLLRNVTDVQFVVVGDGAERTSLEEHVASLGLENVLFLGRVPRAEVAGILRRADASLVMLRPSPVFETVLPSKLFEGMGTATPILLGVDGEARRLLERADAGIHFQPGDAPALVRAIEKLRADPAEAKRMGGNGMRFTLAHFERKGIARTYAAELRTLVESPDVATNCNVLAGGRS